MKKQKGFSTEQQILDAIDLCNERSRELMAEASILEEEIKSDLGQIAEFEAKIGGWRSKKELDDAAKYCNALKVFLPGKRIKQKKLEKSASNLIEKKAKRIGAALSAFRTQPMVAVLAGDCSVILP